jgi:hypothetical protein
MNGVVIAAEKGMGYGVLAQATSIVPKVAPNATEQEHLEQTLHEREQGIRRLP